MSKATCSTKKSFLLIFNLHHQGFHTSLHSRSAINLEEKYDACRHVAKFSHVKRAIANGLLFACFND